MEVPFRTHDHLQYELELENYHKRLVRALFRTGATGASAPAEIKQRVRRTLPKDEFNLKVSHFGVKRS